MSSGMLSEYTDDYYKNAQEQQALELEYQKSLMSLSSQNCYAALVTFMASTSMIVLESYGIIMTQAATTMNALSAMQSDTNTMQSAYNEYVSTGNTDDLQSAIDAARELQNFALQDPSIANSSIANDVLDQIDTIMGPATDVADDGEEYWTTSNVESYWSASEDAYNASGADTAVDAASGDDSPQLIENAFSALSTDNSNLSSTAQSTAQYYSNAQQQAEGEDETTMQGYASELSTMVQNQQTS